jgi:hypothetical protein
MKPFVLIESGAARACIVLPENASPTEQHAVEELNFHLQKISGASLPVMSTPPIEANAVLIGKDLATAHLPDFDWSTLGEDGVLVRAADNNLILAGNTPRGTLYAVYEFLERVLGCRWLTASCSIIPKRETIEIGANLDIVHIPTFRYREPFYGVGDDADWASRNRVNGQRFPLDETRGGRWEYCGFVHTFYELLSPQEYFAAHPEYFSLQNGERNWVGGQLCLTNPEVLEIVAENARKKLRGQTGARVLSVSQNDWNGACGCENCTALDKAEGSPSGTLIHFVNGVAGRIEAEFPHVYVDTLAYTYTVEPPLHVRPRKNVIVRLCHMTPSCDSHSIESCEVNRPFLDYLQRWCAISPEVFIWDYFTNFLHYLMPYPNLDAICADIPLFARQGVTGVFCQGDGAPTKGPSEFAELRAYLFAKLLWNAEQDGHAIITEFLDGFYGAAAKPIKEYIELMHDIAREPDNHLTMYGSLDQPFLTPELLEKSDALFAKALSLVVGDEVLSQRVATARLSPEYVYVKRHAVYGLSETKYALPHAEVQRRAAPFFATAKASGIQALREGGRSLDEEAAGLHDYDLLNLEHGGLKLQILPAMGGRILGLFDSQTNENWMHLALPFEPDYPFAGGYEEYSQAQWHSPGWRDEYSVSSDGASAHLSANLQNGLKLERVYRLENDAVLRIETRLTNITNEKQKIAPRFHPDFASIDWDTTHIQAKAANGGLVELAPWQNSTAERGSLWLEGEDVPAGSWSVLRGSRRLTVEWETEKIEKCLIDWNRSYQSVCPELFGKPQWLEVGESFTLEQRWVLGDV